MDKKELDNELKNGLNSNLYLLFGEETFLTNMYENKIASLASDLTMNVDIFEGNKVSPNAIADTYTTLSFFSDKRVVCVRGSGLFYRGRTDDSEKMLEYLKDLPEDCVLIFNEINVDKRSKMYKYLGKNGAVCELNKLDDNSLSNWIIGIAKENNCTITNENAIYLTRILSNNMHNINSELSKVISSINSGVITKDIIDELIVPDLQVRIFDLVDAIGNKNTEKSLNIYNNMLLMKDSPIMILTMIGRQFKIMLQCKMLLTNTSNQNEIGASLGVAPFIIRNTIGQSKNFTKLILYQAFEEVLATDINIKTGKITDKLGVELIILKYSSR